MKAQRTTGHEELCISPTEHLAGIVGGLGMYANLLHRFLSTKLNLPRPHNHSKVWHKPIILFLLLEMQWTFLELFTLQPSAAADLSRALSPAYSHVPVPLPHPHLFICWLSA